MGASSQPDDVAHLRAAFPGWTFGSLWVTVGTGPDVRRLWAAHGAVFVSAWTVEDLTAEVAKYRFPEGAL